MRPGDIIRVTFKNGDPFNGVVLSIRLRGIDTSVLLRNELTRVAVEMSVKAFSPTVQSVEIVERAKRKPRRARLYYMRYVFPMCDFFSVLSDILMLDSLISGPRSTIAAVWRMLWLLMCARRELSWVARGNSAEAYNVPISIFQHVLLSVHIQYVSISVLFLQASRS